MRILLSACVSLLALVGCSSDASSPPGGSGGMTGLGGAAGGSAVSQGSAQVRFLYEADWEDHLGPTCAWISEYRLKFGGNPLPITVPIDVTAGALGEYVTLEGRTYKDEDVLHIFTCSKSQTSKQTTQAYGRFGADLTFEAGHQYTVTLGGSAATTAEDP